MKLYLRQPHKIVCLLGSHMSSKPHLCLLFPDPAAQKCLVPALIWPQAGRGWCLAALAPTQHVQLCAGPIRGSLAGETFLAQVKREAFYHSPRQTKQLT